MPLSALVTAAAFEPTTVDTSEDFLATDVAMAPVGGGLVGMSASSSGLVVPSFAVAALPVAPPPVPQTMDCSPPDPAGLSPEPSLAPASSAQPPPAAAPVFPALAPAPVFSTLPSASALSAPAAAPAPMISFSSVRTSGPTAARRMGTGPSSSRVVHRAAPSPSVTTLAKQDWSLPDDHLLSLKPATWGMTDAQLAAHPGVDLSLSLAIASRHERYNALAATKIKKAAILLRLQMLAWDATGIQTDKKLAECLKGLLEDAAEDFATPPPGLAPDAVRDFAVAIVFLWNQVVLPLDGVLGRYAVDRFGGPGGAHWFGSFKADIRAVGAGLGLPLL
ncbi:hypothetical protein CC80DRAFT_541650 [Byssothecium circinans]|uniref:Uncharacterized protein n=1 Tax=Byssothecium circinans TaxID=147558 RepID=A0A6A5UFQ3_9PLEO|nr:hypothetical protein CC80DRAFT_541650 [Byssothecium circinans]